MGHLINFRGDMAQSVLEIAIKCVVLYLALICWELGAHRVRTNVEGVIIYWFTIQVC